MTWKDRVGMAVVGALVLVGSSRAEAEETSLADQDATTVIADCIVSYESDWNPRAYNARSGAAGLGQFLYSTWLTTPQGRAGASRYDAEANYAAIVWMVRSGRAREFDAYRWFCS